MSQSNIEGGNRTNQNLYVITLLQTRTGFHLACKKGHTEIVKLLMARDDLKVNSKDIVRHQYSEISHNRTQIV